MTLNYLTNHAHVAMGYSRGFIMKIKEIQSGIKPLCAENKIQSECTAFETDFAEWNDCQIQINGHWRMILWWNHFWIVFGDFYKCDRINIELFN